MKLVRNLLAVIGLATLVLLIAAFAWYRLALDGYDPRFVAVYGDFAGKLLRTGDPGAAMMWSVPVEEGLTNDEVIASLKSLAASKNFLFVGESPFYRQIEAITGEPYRYVNFLSFCDARVGRAMLEHHDYYSGFMPCRIALVEDNAGKLWLHSMNLDLMIHGGEELPSDLKRQAIEVRNTIRGMMEGAAAGDF